MGFLIWRLILGALCAGAVLAAVERLVAWRRTDPATDDEQWRNDMFGGRMSAAPFVAAVAGMVIVTIALAHALFGVLSNVSGFIFFLMGAAIVAAVRRTHLPSIRDAVLEAVRELKLIDDQQAGPDRLRPRRKDTDSVASSTDAERPVASPVAAGRQAPAGRERPPRRKRRASVPASTIDVQVKRAVERPAAGRSAPSPWAAPAATERTAPRREEPALVDVRRALIAHLEARSKALAAVMPVAAPSMPVVTEAPGPVAASQASAEKAAAGTEPEDWRQEAAAQRDMWRRAGEAQRQQWREEAQAVQKSLGRPSQK